MSPEVATTPPWREVFCSQYFKKHLFILAVDEAHCITEWLVYRMLSVIRSTYITFSVHRSTNFRTAFGMIGGLRALCDTPIMALTATASKETQTLICSSLSISQPVIISQRLNRPNIFFSATGIKLLAVSILKHVILVASAMLCNFREILVVWHIFCRLQSAQMMYLKH